MIHVVRITIPGDVRRVEHTEEKKRYDLWLLEHATSCWLGFFGVTGDLKTRKDGTVIQNDAAFHIDYHFRCADDAMLFKLTWGGQ